MIPRPPQTQPNPIRNPSKKTKKTRQRLNPINIDKFDNSVYEAYIKLHTHIYEKRFTHSFFFLPNEGYNYIYRMYS